MDNKKRTDRPDDVAKLVRLAGGSAIPRERMERVRAVAKAQWREETRSRSRSWIGWSVLAAAAALATVALLTGILRPGGTGSTSLARVEGLSGTVALRDGSTVTDLAIGDTIPFSASIETGPNGATALRLSTGHSLRVDRDSAIAIHGERSIELTAGAVYAESDPEREGSGLDVRTPYGQVREIGTQFELRLLDDGLRVRLREGAVRIEYSGVEDTVEAGTELWIDASGRSDRRPIASYGNGWLWVSELAPVQDWNGRSAYEFLRWISREKGWSLTFSDPATLRAARSAIVQGRFDRLSPDEAMDAVLPASRLEYRLTEGNLVVSALP